MPLGARWPVATISSLLPSYSHERGSRDAAPWPRAALDEIKISFRIRGQVEANVVWLLIDIVIKTLIKSASPSAFKSCSRVI